MHRPPLPPGNIPGTHFCYRLSQPQGHSAAERIMSIEKSSDTIGNRTRDLLTCSAVPKPTAPPRPPIYIHGPVKGSQFLSCWVSVSYQVRLLNSLKIPICYLLALLGAHHFFHVSRIRVKSLNFRLLMSYIYGAPILDVSRSHTTTHHSR